MKMDTEKEFPQRKRLRLKDFDYNTPGAYFVTVCTHNRRCTLSRPYYLITFKTLSFEKPALDVKIEMIM